MMVLRVDSEAVLRALRENPQTRRYLRESLGPRAVQVYARHRQDLRDEMVKMGLLLQMGEQGSDGPLSNGAPGAC
jgi:hypothetical protein